MPQLTFGIYDHGIHADAEFGQLRISGRDESGFRPYFLITSGVVGCATGVLRREFSARGVEYEDIKVVADVTRNAAKSNRIEQIDMEFFLTLKGEVPKQSIDDAMHAMLDTSSMIQTVRDSIKIVARLALVTP